ncbi:Fc receptor-like protein 5 [Astyanax mexicanus]|uniref:Fc receptor-like protein 5 n=1 Tax=Astyanax mexicanus TaxID=7994 RepID=UPI0020CB60E3|nr:Fc receptor-like protein 5 [Astyanax mexicanus]
MVAQKTTIDILHKEGKKQKVIAKEAGYLPAATLTIEPRWSPVFTGESVTLKCEITGYDGWRYQWYKGSSKTAVSESQINTFTISSAADQDQYWCRGERDNRPRSSQNSNKVTLTVRDLPTASLTVDPGSTVFTGESVTLKCEITGSGGWRYQWYKGSSQITTSTDKKHTFTISSAADQDQYWCRGERDNRPTSSQNSTKVTLTVRETPKPEPKTLKLNGETVTLRCDLQGGGDTEWTYSWYKNETIVHTSNTSQEYRISSVNLTDSAKSQAVLSVSPQNWLTEGDSVTLSCEVRDSSTGWRFSWYKEKDELLSDSSRRSGGFYTLSSAALKNTGVYMCRAERGEPAYHTQYSNPQPLWITASSSPVSLIVSPRRSQHFPLDPLSLICEGQSSSTGWRVRRYSLSESKVSDCSSGWGSVTGSTCNISYLIPTDTGVYWCESESGGSSNPVNITVHSKSSTA